MKVSEITSSNIASYLKLETGEYETEELQMYIDTAKTFIKSYTGLKDETVTDESIGTGDGITTVFYTLNTPVAAGSLKVYIDGVEKTLGTDYTVDYNKGKIEFITAPVDKSTITATYTYGIDAYEDFSIVVYILCQDMYYNRSLYVDKSCLNKVVDTILGMHCVNLL